MDWQRYKKFDYLAATQEGADACVILFHGYGADANDLASLARVYKLQEKTDWIFPQGVHEVPIGPMMTGRAWFQMRVSDFEDVAQGNVSEHVRSDDEQLLNEVSEWLNHIGKLYKKVFIGGFSQGAILTSHVFYRLNFSPQALLLLSGYLVGPGSFPTEIPENLRLPFFQSHGKQDPVLPIAGARKLFEKLESAGLKGQWKEFFGAHEIPMDVIADTQIFLNSFLGERE